MVKELFKKFRENKSLQFEIIAVILIILFSISISPKTLQNDTYYTVKIGESIAQNGVDMKDHFSWHENLEYTYPHWLYDYGLYLVYNLGSWDAVYLSTCILSIILGLSIYKVNNKLANNKVLSFFITIGAMYLLRGYVAARAQLVTFILFIWAIYLIERFLNTKKIRYGVGLIAISLLIANLHVAVWPFLFILFLPYIGEYIISVLCDFILYKKLEIFILKRIIKFLNKSKKEKAHEKIKKYELELEKKTKKVDRIKEARKENLENPYKIRMEINPNVKWLILIMVICALMGLITPTGDNPYTHLYKLMQGTTTQNINEHLPLTLAENNPIMCTLIIILGTMTFTKSKIKLCDLFMLGGLVYLMFVSRRQSSMFVLIGSVILNKMLIELLEIYGICKVKEAIKIVNIYTLIILTIAGVALSYHFYRPKIDDEYVSSSTYPVDASEWILENLDVNNIRLFNEYNYGSYLLYKGIPVFIDSRADLYSPEFNNGCNVFSDFISASGIGTYYGDIFKKYEITHIIVYKNSKINMLIKKADSEKYNLLYSDKNFVIYEIMEY